MRVAPGKKQTVIPSMCDNTVTTAMYPLLIFSSLGKTKDKKAKGNETQ